MQKLKLHAYFPSFMCILWFVVALCMFRQRGSSVITAQNAHAYTTALHHHHTSLCVFRGSAVWNHYCNHTCLL